ncbi:aminomethyltransferase [Stieleria sp. ICT_E10.1]|uniref:CAF17-like 4Fe-4S cluster assembly/insertion protein YgfZ n=1 Tax=Stieleria sedimenti TaxID=2976331 RepID=UPI00217FED13|nr:aminomethyltransferase [Stieleria sedimenti]MCS7470740.1 aminomethyltransferase [Stieleria sedimenti]
MSAVFRLSAATVLDLVGDDATAILNNLTTNDVKSLQTGCGCETFLTDVRGKMVAHVVAFRTPEGYRLIGADGQADAITAHADRYTIREDATPVDRSSEYTVFVLAPDAPVTLREETDWGESNAVCYDVDWLGDQTRVLITETPGAIEQVIRSTGETAADDDEFHHARTLAGYPWFGVDLSEKNLPQEASRIKQSISFTKGCYLGQETVARLDALGQVQKQLVRWQTLGSIPAAGSEVSADGKVVGRLTSVAQTGDDTAVAIGIARRSHFDPGAVAQGDGFAATVI